MIDQNNFTPFGLRQEGYNNVLNATGNDVAQKFRFNGQEEEKSNGLDVIEMDWKQYDAGAARFFGIDLLAEQSYALTPYHFAGNNPIVFADPSGLKPIIPKDPAVPSGGGALGSYGNMMNGSFLDNIHNSFWATGMGYGPFVTGWGSGGNGSGDSPKGAMAFSSIDDMLSAIEQLDALNPDGFTLYNGGGNTFDAYSGVLLNEVFVTMGADGHFVDGDGFLANAMDQVARYIVGNTATLETGFDYSIGNEFVGKVGISAYYSKSTGREGIFNTDLVSHTSLNKAMKTETNAEYNINLRILKFTLKPDDIGFEYEIGPQGIFTLKEGYSLENGRTKGFSISDYSLEVSQKPGMLQAVLMSVITGGITSQFIPSATAAANYGH